MKYPIEYIRENIPIFDIPPYKGQRYEAFVPDTLDIQERAALAVNGLTGPTDPEKDFMLYFITWFRCQVYWIMLWRWEIRILPGLCGEVGCSVNDGIRMVKWEGRYASVGEVQEGDTVSVTFPIVESTKEVDIEKQHYILTLRGNEVVNIDPAGRYHPLYQRNHYRRGVVRWKKSERFVSDEAIYW